MLFCPTRRYQLLHPAFHDRADHVRYGFDLKHVMLRLNLNSPCGLSYPYQMSHVMRRPAFCICENKEVTAQLTSAFVFATWIVRSLFYLNPKFQASCHLLWLYSPVCVGPDRKPRRPVFSQRGSNWRKPFSVSRMAGNFFLYH